MCSNTPVYSITVKGWTYHFCPTHAAAVAIQSDLDELDPDSILIPMNRHDSEVLVCDETIKGFEPKTPSS